jgi:hypothetical protein
MTDNLENPQQPVIRLSPVEQFLVSVEARVPSAEHKRLLAACRQPDPVIAMENVLHELVREALK